MFSVFNIKPPSFSELKAEKICSSHFKLSCKAHDLYSDRDQNFLIQSNSDQKYVLKISNPEERREILDLQNEATLFIHSQDSNFGVIDNFLFPILIFIRNDCTKKISAFAIISRILY